MDGPQLKPRRGALAYCMKGYLGLIVEDEPSVKRPDYGNRVIRVWRGVHIGRHKVGRPWQTRAPVVVGYVQDVDLFLEQLKQQAS